MANSSGEVGAKSHDRVVEALGFGIVDS